MHVVCVHFCCQALEVVAWRRWAGCRGTDVLTLQPWSLPCHQLAPQRLWHRAIPKSPSCSPTLPCPCNRGKGFPGTIPMPTLAAWGKEIPFPSWGISIYKAAKLLRTAALGRTYFQIFSVAALYILWFSLMRYAGLSMATTEIAFFLKKQQVTENEKFTWIKSTSLRTSGSPSKQTPLAGMQLCLHGEQEWGNSVWQTLITVLNALWKKANWEQEEPSKNLSYLCLTCLCPSPSWAHPRSLTSALGCAFKVHSHLFPLKKKKKKGLACASLHLPKHPARLASWPWSQLVSISLLPLWSVSFISLYLLQSSLFLQSSMTCSQPHKYLSLKWLDHL